MVIRVAHDFTCPWCWIGLHQAKRLERNFEAEIEWLAYELMPEGMEWPPPRAKTAIPGKPETPSRLALAYAAEGMRAPNAKTPHQMTTHEAHEAVEFAKAHGVANELVERLYRAYWLEGSDLRDLDTLKRLATGLVPNLADFEAAIRQRKYAERIVAFDEPAYESGVYNVPTFCIGDHRLAEQPYMALEAAMREVLQKQAPEGVYPGLVFGPAPDDRPYIAMNMISTLDGKILSGERDEPVADLGSERDHLTMRQIERAAGAVLIGAGSLRATHGLHYPKQMWRFVVSGSAKVDPSSPFFAGALEKAVLLTTESSNPPKGIQVWRAGRDQVDLRAMLRRMRDELGLEKLLVEGGSLLNAQLFALDAVDELFLTLSPKIKLGEDVPTIADGEPLPREELRNYQQVSCRVFGDETFLRYVRKR